MEAIILSSWNHIMGSLIEKLWLVDEDTTNVSEIPRDILNDFNISKHNKDMLSTAACFVPDMEVYSVMCGQLLLSEIDSCKSDDEWASRFYVSEHKIIVAIIFHLPNWADCPSSSDGNDTCMCFGIIFKNKDIDFVLKSFAAIDQSLRRIIKIIEEAVLPFFEDITSTSGTAYVILLRNFEVLVFLKDILRQLQRSKTLEKCDEVSYLSSSSPDTTQDLLCDRKSWENNEVEIKNNQDMSFK
ncbi:UNVERIFIED_CONTAM: hypothetical protein NCL1_40907 [Trichonephila clavipes]